MSTAGLLIRQLNTARVPHPFPRFLREWVGENVTHFLPDQYETDHPLPACAEMATKHRIDRRRKINKINKLSGMISISLLLTCFTAPGAAFSQAAAAAYQGSLPLTIGAGVSNLDVGWGRNRMYGIAVWAQWHPKFLSPAFKGFGINAEGRDVNYGRCRTLLSNFRMDAFGAGPMAR